MLTLVDNGFYLFLDDVRDPETVYPSNVFIWKVARSTEEAKALVLEHGMPLHMSLDHDLGGDDTTMKFLRWLSDTMPETTLVDRSKHWKLTPSYIVHSANPVGSDNIISFMESWKRSVAS